MTKVFIIAIVMWWSDPILTPSNDSVEITHLHGKPLYFETIEECGDHIDENLQALKNYGRSVYPTSHAVKTIYCVQKDKKINNKFI
tara:strand:- start:8 stop:265 length:258 start_codon:yes stop_codon:yes gene_type:complete